MQSAHMKAAAFVWLRFAILAAHRPMEDHFTVRTNIKVLIKGMNKSLGE